MNENKKARILGMVIEIIGSMIITGIVTGIQAMIANRNEDDVKENAKLYLKEVVDEELPKVLDDMMNGN